MKKDPKEWTFAQASMYFLEHCETRNREPVKQSTLDAYRAHITHIRETLGDRKLACFTVSDMKDFVQVLVAKKLSAKRIEVIVSTLASIVAFPRDKNLNRVFTVSFPAKLIDRPRVNPREQNAPIVSREVLEAAIAPKDETALLLTLLASSGLRINEALNIKIQGPSDDANTWHPGSATVYVRAHLKTEAARRDIELSREVHEFLVTHADLTREKLFPMGESYYRKLISERQVPGFHSCRRFFETQLGRSFMPRAVMIYWMGHSGKTIGDRYDKNGDDAAFRRETRDRIPKGFDLPI
jgi:site-specific recombinase XerD